MSNPEIHSVILNLNKNYSNNKAYDFKQIVNQKIELRPNSLVALYTGNLVRKPIMIDTDTTLTIDLLSAFPTINQLATLDHTDDIIDPFVSFSVVVPEGIYSRLSFCRILTERINQVVISTDYQEVDTDIVPIEGSADVMVKSFPYQCYYEINEGEFFIGLRYFAHTRRMVTGVNVATDIDLVKFKNLDDNMNTSNAVTMTNIDTIIHRTVRADDWDSYALGNSPVRGMCCHTGEDKDALGGDIGFITTQLKVDYPGASTQDMEFLFGLNNTYFSEAWGSVGNSPTLVSLPAEGITIPQVLIGAYFDMTANSTEVMDKQRLVIFANREISALDYDDMSDEASRDFVVGTEYRNLASCDLTAYGVDVGDGVTLRWEIYSENVPPSIYEDGVLQEERRYYFRFCVSSPSEQGSQTCIYDSKSSNLFLNSNIVESGYMFQQMTCYSDADKATTAGLCPQFYFKNTNDDCKVISPRCNNIASYIEEANRFFYYEGQLGYSWIINDGLAVNTNTSCLRNILGISANSRTTFVGNWINSLNTIFDPNAFPRRPEMGGLTRLESDKTRYNIELNLPIKAFNTTESSANDLGQQRTILYNTNPVVEDVTDISNSLVNKNLEPSGIKWLSLNNPRPMKLNAIDIKIRRAKTNELADELTDASIEILIKSEKPPESDMLAKLF